MSTPGSYGSSAINKLSRKFAPKAVNRRRPGLLAEPTSTNASNLAKGNSQGQSLLIPPTLLSVEEVTEKASSKDQSSYDNVVASVSHSKSPEAPIDGANRAEEPEAQKKHLAERIALSNHTSTAISTAGLARENTVHSNEELAHSFMGVRGGASEPRYPKRQKLTSPSQNSRQLILSDVQNNRPSVELSMNDAHGSTSLERLAKTSRNIPNNYTSRENGAPLTGNSTAQQREYLKSTSIENGHGDFNFAQYAAPAQQDDLAIDDEAVLMSLRRVDNGQDSSDRAVKKLRKTRKDKGTTRPAKKIGPDSGISENRKGLGAVTTNSRSGQSTTGTEADDGSVQDIVVDEDSRKKRRKRAGTPNDAENAVIDPDEITMDRLLSIRSGEVSHRERAMRQIDWEEVKKRRKEALSGNAVTDEGNQAQVSEELERAARERDAAQTRGPRMRILNGAIVVDQASLTIDRHAEATRADETLEAVEEDDLTRRFNTATYMRANKRDPAERLPMGTTKRDRWTAEQTDAFYEAIRMFGTDFAIIAKMFPGKTRGNIKRKFVREEHANPDRVKSALIREAVPLDFDAFLSASGLQAADFVEDVGAIRDELAAEAAARQVEIDKVKAEHEEMQRQRRLANGGDAGDDAEKGGTEAGGRKRGKGKTGAKKKGKHALHGDEVEIVETIED